MNGQTIIECINNAMLKPCVVGRKKFTFSKRYDVEVTLTLDEAGRYEFSACGEVWRNASRRGECEECGQCLDSIKEGLKDTEPLFNEIYSLWKKHHLNGMHSGTRKQEEFLARYKEERGMERLGFADACEVLKANGIEIDKLTDGTQYRYGSGWLYREIPNGDLESIKRILGVG